MNQETRGILFQLYLLSVCLLCLVALGVAGSVALLGALRMQYPKIMIGAASWDEWTATRSSPEPLSLDDPQRGDTQTMRSGSTRRTVLRRERHLGRRQLVWGASVMMVAMLIFLPHWWATRRSDRKLRMDQRAQR